MIREFIYRLGQRRRSRRLRERLSPYGHGRDAFVYGPLQCGEPMAAEGIAEHHRQQAARPRGVCPRGTPKCTLADCSPAPGRSCDGPSAPRHVDMGP